MSGTRVPGRGDQIALQTPGRGGQIAPRLGSSRRPPARQIAMPGSRCGRRDGAARGRGAAKYGPRRWWPRWPESGLRRSRRQRWARRVAARSTRTRRAAKTAAAAASRAAPSSGKSVSAAGVRLRLRPPVCPHPGGVRQSIVGTARVPPGVPLTAALPGAPPASRPRATAAPPSSALPAVEIRNRLMDRVFNATVNAGAAVPSDSTLGRHAKNNARAVTRACASAYPSTPLVSRDAHSSMPRTRRV